MVVPIVAAPTAVVSIARWSKVVSASVVALIVVAASVHAVSRCFDSTTAVVSSASSVFVSVASVSAGVPSVFVTAPIAITGRVLVSCVGSTAATGVFFRVLRTTAVSIVVTAHVSSIVALALVAVSSVTTTVPTVSVVGSRGSLVVAGVGGARGSLISPRGRVLLNGRGTVTGSAPRP